MSIPLQIPGPSRHIPSLDGLRGLAILVVVVYHYFNLPYGWSGVDLFFVLSGYLITGRLLDSLHQPAYYRNFYRNRVLRIFPLYFGVLALFAFGINFISKQSTQPLLAFYYQHWLSFILFTENFSFIRYGMPVTPYLLHFWSLAIEEQFYLVWPFLLRRTKDRKTRLILLPVLILLVMLIRSLFYWNHIHTDSLTFYYYNTFFRIDALLTGALLCQLHRSQLVLPARLINLLFAACILTIGISCVWLKSLDLSNPFFETVGYTLTALLYACLLHKTVSSTGALSKIFSLSPLRLLGKISYGLYVFHFPVVLILYTRLFNWGKAHSALSDLPLQIAVLLLCLLISLVLALLSFRYFESFFLRFKAPAPASSAPTSSGTSSHTRY